MAEQIEIRSGRAGLAAEQTGEGPTLVLLHAGVADRRSWRAVADARAERWRVVAYDRRGFGDTSYESEPFSNVDDLMAVLDAIGAEDAVLVGSSQGGLIALDAALAAPERVRGLVLVAPAVSGAELVVEDPEEVLDLANAIDEADGRGDLDAVNRLEAHYWLDGPLSSEGRVTGAARDLFLDMNGRALRAPSPGDERPGDPAWPRLEQVTAPTLVLTCELDEPSGTAIAAAAARRIPGAQLAELPDVAHVPQLEHPALLIEAITPHLEAVRNSTSR